MIDKIVVEQCLDALPQDLRVWVASHTPGTAAVVAELIESYESRYVQKCHQGQRSNINPIRTLLVMNY